MPSGPGDLSDGRAESFFSTSLSLNMLTIGEFEAGGT